MTKGDSKFGGTSTVRTRHLLRQAARDPEVHNLVLQVYSPGGHVDGVQELADEVWQIGTQKPVVAHIEDLGASAAYWVASQAGRITANATAEIGSIGTMAVLEDTSKRLERLGIQVHVVATGPYKGLGVDGAPVSQEALGYVRARVEAINAHFLASVQRGRRFRADSLEVVSDGRVHHAGPAQRLGLIDAVQSLDQTLEELRRGRQPGPSPLAAGLPGYATQAATMALRAQQRRHHDLTHTRRETIL
jgi:signal peptide peptidase SppA